MSRYTEVVGSQLKFKSFTNVAFHGEREGSTEIPISHKMLHSYRGGWSSTSASNSGLTLAADLRNQKVSQIAWQNSNVSHELHFIRRVGSLQNLIFHFYFNAWKRVGMSVCSSTHQIYKILTVWIYILELQVFSNIDTTKISKLNLIACYAPLD